MFVTVQHACFHHPARSSRAVRPMQISRPSTEAFFHRDFHLGVVMHGKCIPWCVLSAILARWPGIRCLTRPQCSLRLTLARRTCLLPRLHRRRRICTRFGGSFQLSLSEFQPLHFSSVCYTSDRFGPLAFHLKNAVMLFTITLGTQNSERGTLADPKGRVVGLSGSPNPRIACSHEVRVRVSP